MTAFNPVIKPRENSCESSLLGGAGPSNSSAKLRRAATQFESILISSLLEKFEDLAKAPGEDSRDAGGESLHSIAIQAVAGKLAESGGFGIARMILSKIPAECEGKYLPQDSVKVADSVQ